MGKVSFHLVIAILVGLLVASLSSFSFTPAISGVKVESASEITVTSKSDIKILEPKKFEATFGKKIVFKPKQFLFTFSTVSVGVFHMLDSGTIDADLMDSALLSLLRAKTSFG